MPLPPCYRCKSQPCECSDGVTLYCGDMLELLPELPVGSIDTVCTDPPYGLEFMGQGWDKGIPGVQFWELIRSVVKPGAMLTSFGGTRTFHRLVCAIEDAGWECRDLLLWLFSSGFPKSLDIGKALDKAAGAEREVVGYSQGRSTSIHKGGQSVGHPDAITAPATPLAKQWDGYGTALSPSFEPICLAMAPLDGTFAANAEKHGVGGINVDGGRIEHNEECRPMKAQPGGNKVYAQSGRYAETLELKPSGRWPKNAILDGSEEVEALFPETGPSGVSTHPVGTGGIWSGVSNRPCGPQYGDSGSAARFYKVCPRAIYTPKASGKDRGNRPAEERTLFDEARPEFRNTHPTVKPLALVTYLLKLLYPPSPEAVCLDPFAGSGTTGVAAKAMGRRCILIELEAEYCEIITERLRGAK